MEIYDHVRWLCEATATKRNKTLGKLVKLRKLIEDMKMIDDTSLVFEEILELTSELE